MSTATHMTYRCIDFRHTAATAGVQKQIWFALGVLAPLFCSVPRHTLQNVQGLDKERRSGTTRQSGTSELASQAELDGTVDKSGN